MLSQKLQRNEEKKFRQKEACTIAMKIKCEVKDLNIHLRLQAE